MTDVDPLNRRVMEQMLVGVATRRYARSAAESLISRARLVKRNVKRRRGGQMMLRWVAAGVLEAVKGFRRLKGSVNCRRSSQPSAHAINSSG